MPPRLFIFLQYIAPKRLLTRIALSVSNAKNKHWTPSLIRWFVKRYDVQMHEAERADGTSYESFNDFFTRALKNGVRPIAESTWVQPADGSVASLGAIKSGTIFQAKGKSFTAVALLGGDKIAAKRFENGIYATIYLSPKDYHRVHMPIAGRLLSMCYVPGDLFSVSLLTAQYVDQLFARNERVITMFDTSEGLLCMVLVGATIVGSIATVWHGVVNECHARQVQHWDYQDQHIMLDKGQEMGRFLLGSTVVLLGESSRLQFISDLVPATPVRVGAELAIMAHPSN